MRGIRAAVQAVVRLIALGAARSSLPRPMSALDIDALDLKFDEAKMDGTDWLTGVP